jgi:hypothetical protein
MKNKVLELLKFLDAKIPTNGGHHSLTAGQYGSDSLGWEDRLVLSIRVAPNHSELFFIDESDFENPRAVYDEIIRHL